MAKSNADRNLLFGILALQMDFATRDQLVAATTAWVRNKERSLESILLEQGALAADTLELLSALVNKHLALHDNDAEKSLAAVSSIASAREELQKIADTDLHASLGHVARDRKEEDDPWRTNIPMADALAAAGNPTSTGNRFRILRPYAKGGLGEVFVAEDKELHREVALKEIQNRHAHRAESRSRFVLEAEITGGLEHPGIVPVYGLGYYSDGRPFYAMRFIRGDNLQDAIKRFHAADTDANRDPGERALEFRKLLQRFIDVCNALEYAHSRGVLHRDLKPGNIMLGKYGETLVVDWGLAKVLGHREHEPSEGETTLRPASEDGVESTQMGSAVGTPQYMSPEQASGRLDQLGTASDVYSLGATLYAVLTGKAPFADAQKGGVAMVLTRVQTGEFIRPRQLQKNLAAPLEAICLKAMSLKPADRYVSPRALADDIEHWMADEPVLALRESWVQRLTRLARRHRAWTQAAAATLVVVAVSAVVSAVAIHRANTREIRALRISAATDKFNRSLHDAAEWDATKLSDLDGLVGELDELQDINAKDYALQVPQAFADSIAAVLRGGKSLTTDDVNRLRQQIELLSPRNSQAATKLDEELKGRIREWTDIFRLEAPFQTAADVFQLAQVRVDGNAIVSQQSETDGAPTAIPSQVASAGNVEAAVEFDESWTLAPEVGLCLNLQGAQRYEFVICIPGFDAGDRRQLSRTMQEYLDLRRDLEVRIVRNGVVLRQTSVNLTSGPLNLVARREGDVVKLHVQNQPTLEFVDLFAISPATPGHFGLIWPTQVHVLRFVGKHQALPVEPSALERGDEFYASGDYEQALKFYQEMRAAESGAGQEARYKQAVCLADLGREAEAVDIWNRLAATSTASDATSEPWKLRSVCRLWQILIRDKRSREADALLKQMEGKSLEFSDLARIVPLEVRTEILRQYRHDGQRFRLVFNPARDLDNLEAAVNVEGLIGEDPKDLLNTRWRLIDAMRVAGDKDRTKKEKAKAMAKQLCDEADDPKLALTTRERLALRRDYVWVLLELGEHEQALKEVDDWLAKQENLPLLSERARILGNQQKDALAMEALDQFFASVKPEEIDYCDYGEACLMRGFLLHPASNPQAAQEAWKRGLFENMRGRIPQATSGQLLRGVDMIGRTNGISVWGMLVSLTKTETPEIAQSQLHSHIDGTGLRNTFFKNALTQVFKADFVEKVMGNLFRSERGMQVAHKMTFREYNFADYHKEPLYSMFIEGLTSGATPELADDKMLEEVAYEKVKKLVDNFVQADVLDEQGMRDVLSVWQGDAEKWQTAMSVFGDELTVPAAYIFGRRFMHPDNPGKDLAEARKFFEEVVAASPTDDLFHQLAKKELKKLPAP